MAYNTKKGSQHSGDIQYEGDPNDTQIDFENDSIGLKTGGVTRVVVTDTGLSGSGIINTIGSITSSANLAASGSLILGEDRYIGTPSLQELMKIGDGNIQVNGLFKGITGISGSGPFIAMGTSILGSTLAVSGTVFVTEKIEHVGDADTYITFTDDDINFQAGGVNFLDLTEDTQNEATFNEGGVDVDFRVESENDTHMLFVDAANDAVSVGVSTDAPAAVLEVVGDGAAGKPTFTVIHAENTNNAVNITADSITTAKALRISADALTTGNALYIDDDSSSTGTRNTAMVIQNNAAAIAATALTVQSDGGVTGVNLDKNYSDLTEASIVGLNIDWDKTGASTSDNTMYGIQLDMDNATATNGTNIMYGLHVTPTLTHAADAGTTYVYGAHINAQGGTNGGSLVQAARFEAGGGDFNYGIQLDIEDGPDNVDLRIESSADNGDYFQIQTTTHGATTITTVDDNATAANLTFNVDGDITLDPVGGNVFVDGTLSGSGLAQFTSVTASADVVASGSFIVPQGGKVSAAGTSTYLQFNDGNLVTAGIMKVNNAVSASNQIFGTALSSSGDLAVSGNVHATSYYGDGSTLTGVGAMDSLGLRGDTGATQTIVNTNTIYIEGGEGISTVAGATDKVTIHNSGTLAQLTVGVETAGYLRVSGSSTFAGNVSGSGTLHAVGAATFSSTIAATGSVTAVGLYSTELISGSLGMHVDMPTTFGGEVSTTGSVSIGAGISASADLQIVGSGTFSHDVAISGNLGIGVSKPIYDLHINGPAGTVATIDGGAGADAFLRFATNGVEKSYIKLGSGGNLIMAQDATNGDLQLKAKPGGVSTTYINLDGGNSNITASMPIHFQSASYFSGSIYRRNKNVQSSNYTLTLTDNLVFMDTNSNGLTASLPVIDAAADGIEYTIKNIGTKTMVISSPGTTIDGSPVGLTGSLGTSWTLFADNDVWLILSQYTPLV